MPSLSNIEIVKETRTQLTELGAQAAFHIRKWMSNQTEVLRDISVADRASEIDLEQNNL